MKSDQTIIESSKLMAIVLIFTSVGFILLAIWMLSLDAEWIEQQRRFNSPFVVNLIALVTLIFFGLGVVAGIWKLFSKKPGFVLDENGIEIFSMGPNIIVPWVDVSSFSIFKIHSQKMLVINLFEPEKFILGCSGVTNKLARANFGMCGSPIVISSNGFKIKFKDLITLCENYHSKYGNA